MVIEEIFSLLLDCMPNKESDTPSWSLLTGEFWRLNYTQFGAVDGKDPWSRDGPGATTMSDEYWRYGRKMVRVR